MIEELRRYQQVFKEAEKTELTFNKLYLENCQRYLKEQIDSLGIAPRIMDYLSPSREECENFETWSSLNIFSSHSAREYAILYPWGRYPVNVFSTGKRGVFAELTSEGTFRCYSATTRSVSHGGYDTGGYSVDGLYREELPEETDPALLELQALKFINFLREGLFKLKEGASSEGLPENKTLVKNSST